MKLTVQSKAKSKGGGDYYPPPVIILSLPIQTRYNPC